jgi:hypothetical protein
MTQNVNTRVPPARSTRGTPDRERGGRGPWLLPADAGFRRLKLVAGSGNPFD